MFGWVATMFSVIAQLIGGLFKAMAAIFLSAHPF